MPIARDYQREKCYSWERELRAEFKVEPVVEFNDLKIALKAIWANERANFPRKFKLACPSLGDGRGRSRACFSYSNTIKLPSFARSLVVLSHEIAHALESDKEDAWHGARWLGCFIYLLAKYASSEIGLSEQQLVDRAVAYGLKVKSPFAPNTEVAPNYFTFAPIVKKTKQAKADKLTGWQAFAEEAIYCIRADDGEKAIKDVQTLQEILQNRGKLHNDEFWRFANNHQEGFTLIIDYDFFDDVLLIKHQGVREKWRQWLAKKCLDANISFKFEAV